MKRLKKDLKSTLVKKRIENDMAEASKYGLTGTPSFIINGTKLVGAQPIENFEEIINISIKKSGK